jgi:hypothetical protein
MKRALLATVAGLALLGAAEEGGRRLRFRTAGFSIEALDAPPAGDQAQALMMFLPVSDAFAPNVNVMIQPFAGTMEEYLAVTRSQFDAAGITVVSSKVGASSLLLEYTGPMQGRELHWYARAEKAGPRVYLATATATLQQWSRVGTQLKACVDSFKAEK